MAATALAIAIASGCAPRFDRATETREIYDLILKELDFRIQLHTELKSGPIGVVNETLAGKDDVWTIDRVTKTFPALPRAAARDFFVRQRERAQVRGPFTRPVELVTARTPADWESLRSLVEDGNGVVQFSQVGFDRAGHEALVYVVHACGGLCGTGHLIHLTRQDRYWRIVKIALVMQA